MTALLLLGMGALPRYLEELRIGGGYGSAPDGGIDLDAQGNLALDGNLTVDGDAFLGGNLDFSGVDVAWSAFLPAKNGWAAPTSPASGPSLLQLAWVMSGYVFDFDKDSDEYAVFNVMLPGDYDGRAIKCTLYWMATAGSTGDVRWRVHARCYGDGAATSDSSTGLGAIVDAFQGQQVLHTASLSVTPLNATAGKFLVLALRRQASDPTDTFDADARLLGLRIAYKP